MPASRGLRGTPAGKQTLEESLGEDARRQPGSPALSLQVAVSPAADARRAHTKKLLLRWNVNRSCGNIGRCVMVWSFPSTTPTGECWFAEEAEQVEYLCPSPGTDIRRRAPVDPDRHHLRSLVLASPVHSQRPFPARRPGVRSMSHAVFRRSRVVSGERTGTFRVEKASKKQ